VTSSEIRYAIFTSLMRYLYTDEMELENDEDRLDLLVLANLYSVESLKKLIEDDLMQSLDFENVSCLFALADTANALNLRRKCLHFITGTQSTLINPPNQPQQEPPNQSPCWLVVLIHFNSWSLRVFV